MALQRKLNIRDREVSVVELTTAQVRDWMKQIETDATDQVFDLGNILFDDVTLGDLAVMTDLSIEELEDMAPSELREVADACKEVNTHFFMMMARIKPALDQVIENAGL